MLEHAKCVECGAVAPTTSSEDTLISSAHGWRLLRNLGTDGKATFEWRCRKCWEKFKAQRPPASSPKGRPDDEPSSAKSRKPF